MTTKFWIHLALMSKMQGVVTNCMAQIVPSFSTLDEQYGKYT